MKKAITLVFFLFTLCTVVNTVNAQELHEDIQGIWKAKVIDVVSQEKKLVPGTDTESEYQTIIVEILEGDQKGKRVTLDNDFILLKEGQTFFLNYLYTINGDEIYTVRDVDRRPAVIFFIILFIAVIIFFGGKQGIRSILSLGGSLLIIIYILLPALLMGYPPVLISLGIAVIILFLAIYFTHGFNEVSNAAFLGTVISITFTTIIAYIAVLTTQLSGFASDESVYLNISTHGMLNIQGLLLGAIIIGVLGVLDDIAITQASVVRELSASAKHLSKFEIYKSALRVGKEHVGALVNTLALAYTGASLPLLLLYTTGTTGISMMLNYEIFATEIIRTIVGSIGLILTVPITTALAIIMFNKLPSHKEDHSHHTHTHFH